MGVRQSGYRHLRCRWAMPVIARTGQVSPTSGDSILNRLSPCITPRVIPSRGDERSETYPCRGILGSALTLSGNMPCQPVTARPEAG